MKLSVIIVVFLSLQGCKHPLSIVGQGDIVERLIGHRGCSYEEFIAGSARCEENEVSGEPYQVSYRGSPHEGWRFVGWEGTGCDAKSEYPFCEYNIEESGVSLFNTSNPDTVLPPTVAIFRKLPPTAEQNTWVTKRNIPSDHTEAAGCSIDGKLYIIGGRKNNAGRGEFTARVERYNPVTDQWSVRSPIPSSRVLAASAVVDGKCYVFGGQGHFQGIGGPAVATVEVYDPKTNDWSPRKDMPTERFGAAAVSLDGKIYVFGGSTLVSPSEGKRVSAILEIYDPAKDEWSSGAAMGTARMAHAGAAARGAIYAIGGTVNPRSAALTSVEQYNPVKDRWVERRSLPGKKSFLAAATVADKIYAIGGATFHTTKDDATYQYSPDTNQWKTRAKMPEPRNVHTALVIEDSIYVLGGIVRDDQATAQNLLYTPSFP